MERTTLILKRDHPVCRQLLDALALGAEAWLDDATLPLDYNGRFRVRGVKQLRNVDDNTVGLMQFTIARIVERQTRAPLCDSCASGDHSEHGNASGICLVRILPDELCGCAFRPLVNIGDERGHVEPPPTTLTTLVGLDTGDVVRHVLSGNAYVILANYGEYCFAVKHLHLSNPREWVMASKARRD